MGAASKPAAPLHADAVRAALALAGSWLALTHSRAASRQEAARG